jgi:hypothetical protein
MFQPDLAIFRELCTVKSNLKTVVGQTRSRQVLVDFSSSHELLKCFAYMSVLWLVF